MKRVLEIQSKYVDHYNRTTVATRNADQSWPVPPSLLNANANVL